jgi:hypothetical protein
MWKLDPNISINLHTYIMYTDTHTENMFPKVGLSEETMRGRKEKNDRKGLY